MNNLKLSLSTSLLILAACCTSFLQAQTNQGGMPLTYQNDKIDWEVPSMQLAPFDVAAMLEEDEILHASKDHPYRFGKNIVLGRNINNSGAWTKLPSGDRVWHLKINSPEAYSLNVVFDLFQLPEGGRLYIYSPDFEHVLGAYTAENNHPEMEFGTYPIPGEEIVLEYFEPKEVIGQTLLQIGTVTHAYRDLDKVARGIGDSGACNNNVICPVGDDWRDEIDAVAMIVVNGNGICTGAMVNNTANDGHPYFLTANHCLGGSVANWVFRFNWQSTTCSTNNVGNFDTVGGPTLLASGGSADYALLEINSGNPIPTGFNPYYAGWDATGVAPTASVGIHHPSGDLKKISFDNNPAGTASFGGATCWRIFDWEDGTTEPGSSGSPLFDQNKRIVGQLYGGQASCSNNINDYYGKFDVTYPNVCQWLAPGCNTLVLDGYDPNAAVVDNDVQLLNVVEPSGTYCASSVTPEITVRNAGVNALTSFTITYNVNGGANSTQSWTGNLASGATTAVSLPAISPGNGSFTFNVSLSNPNGQIDDNPANNSGSSNFTTVGNGVLANFTLTTDNYPGETTWTITDGGGNVLYSDGPYAGTQTTYTYEFCLPAGCYTLDVFDSFGDGMQYQGVVGDYLLTDQNGVTLAQIVAGGNFGAQATHNFCVSADPVSGCTDPSACNFNPAATSDDGSCEFTSCAGCTDQTALNYDPNASIDDGSCVYPDCTSVTLSISTDCWGEEVSWELINDLGLTVASVAPNTYGNQQTFTWNGCLPAGCYTFNIFDSFGDGMFGSQYGSCTVDGNYVMVDDNGAVLFQMANPDYGSGTTETFCLNGDVPGCTNATACNFDPAATIDDGSCVLPNGCTDANACNFNPAATCDDGSCEFSSCAGCTNATACNFDPSATIDDGSCVLPNGCTDANACNFNPAATCDDGSCEFNSCAGCTNASACNYDPSATIDDGSCVLPNGCTDANACNFNPAATCDDGSCEFSSCAGCTNASACNFDPSATIDDGSCVLPNGCTDVNACNYDPAATCDDGSCVLPDGCTDPNACNYDPAATCDNGFCEYDSCITCPGDFNNDGQINISDLLFLLGEFGCSSNCNADIDLNGAVGTSDAILLLSVFGTACN